MNYITWLSQLFVCFIIYLIPVKATLESEGIIGGHVAKIGQVKYMVSIQSNAEHICGGGIIGEQFVLTAAHCFINDENKFDKGEYTVVAGILNANAKTRSVIRMQVEAVYIPREYRAVSSLPYNFHFRETGDIAVIKLISGLDLQIKSKLSKLELPEQHLTYENTNPIIAGFGSKSVTFIKDLKTDNVDEVSNNLNLQLTWAQTDVLSNKVCEIKALRPIYESHVCAQVQQQYPETPEGVCTGDSGSPLVLNNVVIGILSTSRIGCDESYYPAIYTRVSTFIQFIQNIMNNSITPDIRVKYYMRDRNN